MGQNYYINVNNMFGGCAFHSFAAPSFNTFSTPIFNPFSMPYFNTFSMPIFNPFSKPCFNTFSMPSFNPFSMPALQNNTPLSNFTNSFNNSNIWDFSQFNLSDFISRMFPSTLNLSTNTFNPLSQFNIPEPTSPTSTSTSTNTDTFTRTSRVPQSTPKTTRTTSSWRRDFARNAEYYLGKINSDLEGNRQFSPNGKRQPWCADFVTSVARETFGNRLSSFGSSSVSGLRSWAIQNNCYSKMPSSNKADFIAQNIKIGDIMIEKKGGKSHTGIVTCVYPDGSFDTVEGNCSNKVAKQHYTANSNTLSGFISLDKYSTSMA